MSVRPKSTVQQILISTTSRLTGEYEREGILVTHAWPDWRNGMRHDRWVEGPTSRNAFVFAFETAHIQPEAGQPLPDYSHWGDYLCSCLAVLFGKRFDNHGVIQQNGSYQLPEMTQFSAVCDSRLPQNSHSPRVDFPIPLNLVEVQRVESLFIRGNALENKLLAAFQGASKFYLQALQMSERDPEVAYLHLITSGEILSNTFDRDSESLLDDQTRELLALVRHGMPDGETIARRVESRLRQVKRRFVSSILDSVDDDFFSRSESPHSFARLRHDDFNGRVAAAYDLRSRYVHTGVPFGRWVSRGLGGQPCEIAVGEPVLPDRELSKIIAKAPTFVGLERIVRYSLLQFLKLHGVLVEPPDGQSG